MYVVVLSCWKAEETIGYALTNYALKGNENCRVEKLQPSILERIGHRKKDGGNVTWISHSQWKKEQLKLETSQESFAFCIDDSGDKKKIIITSPALVQAIKRIVPPSLFEIVPNSVSFEEPYVAIFHFLPEMRSDMVTHLGKSEDIDDLQALEYFVYESQPQNKRLRETLTTGQQTHVSFESLWALFKTGEAIVVIDKFEEKRLLKFTYIDEILMDIGKERRICTGLAVRGWGIRWDAARRNFAQQFHSFEISRFSGNRRVKSLPVYPLRFEDETTRNATVLALRQRGCNWVDLNLKGPSCFEYNGHALEVGRYSDSGMRTQVSKYLRYYSYRILIGGLM